MRRRRLKWHQKEQSEVFLEYGLNIVTRRKNMKKSLLAIVLGTVLAFGLTACGSGSSTASAGGETASVTAVEETPSATAGGETASVTAGEETASTEGENDEATPEIPLTKGKADVDVGDFTVTVPEGWLGVGDLDVDENGKYFVEPYYYIIVKGGESAEDQNEKPAVTIYYSPEMDAQSMYDSNKSSVDENTDLDITVGGKKCPAYHSKADYAGEGQEPNYKEYDYVFIPVTDSSCLRVTMLTSTTDDGDTGISVADEDVIAIMESLKVK